MRFTKREYRWAEPGKVTRSTCKVCGTACRIDRNVYGPTNHASAIGALKHRTTTSGAPAREATGTTKRSN